jgi:mediator of RNA polymerase II transcription subunit 7
MEQISMTLPSLPSKGVPQLYDTASNTSTTPRNHAFALHKLAKSILLNFLEYVGILSNSPAHHEQKLLDIQNLFINAHHLINMYRPHQARETLILRMEREIEEARKEIREVRAVMGKVEGVLKELEEEGREVDGVTRDTEKSCLEEKDRKAGTRLWGAMERGLEDD